MCKVVKKSLDERRSNCSCACANHFYVRNDQKRRCTEAVRIPLLSPTHILKDLVEDCPNDWQLLWMSYSNLPFKISFLFFLLFLISPPSLFFLLPLFYFSIVVFPRILPWHGLFGISGFVIFMSAYVRLLYECYKYHAIQYVLSGHRQLNRFPREAFLMRTMAGYSVRLKPRREKVQINFLLESTSI